VSIFSFFAAFYRHDLDPGDRFQLALSHASLSVLIFMSTTIPLTETLISWETSPLALLPISIVVCDGQGSIRWGNPVYCRSIGLTWEQIQGNTIQKHFNLPAVARPNSIDHTFCHRAAVPFPVRITTQRLTQCGQDSSEDLFLLSIEDLRELHQAKAQIQKSHARFREVIEHVSDIYFIHDLAGYFTYIAPQFTQFFGYPVEGRLGKSLEDIIHPDDVAPIEAMLAQVIQTRIPHDNIELRVRHQEGHWVWVLASHSVVLDESGGVKGIQGFVRNISDRKAAEFELQAKTEALALALQELQQNQAQMVQSEKMSSLGQLVAGIAHEINNPVNFIYGNLTYTEQYSQDLLRLITAYQAEISDPSADLQEIMDDIDVDYLRADLPKLVKSMQVGADRIREIVLSLRNFSRLDEAEFKVADLHTGIDSTVMILQNRLKAKDSRPEILLDLDYGDQPEVECYAGQLNQVFMNIIANAIDALEDDWNAGKVAEPRIKVAIETQPEQVMISIQDNGSGIPQENLSRLFDPFYTTKPIGKGTGMGLSISYQIVVDRHGGNLECHSTLGQGTTFLVTLPIKH
jgi:PAS domain S-box-containing protein